MSPLLCLDWLPSLITPADLQRLFSAFGTVLWTRVVTGKDGHSLGFGYVMMETPAQAEKARWALDGMELRGRVVRVTSLPSLVPVDRQGALLHE